MTLQKVLWEFIKEKIRMKMTFLKRRISMRWKIK